MRRSPVIIVGLDACDPRRLKRLMAAGRLPTLARVERASHRLTVLPEWKGIATEPWNSFLRRMPLEQHGRFHVKLWDPIGCAPVPAPAPSPTECRPFWGEAASRGARLAAVDVPFFPPSVHAPIFVGDWQAHDRAFGGERALTRGLSFQLPDGGKGIGAEPYGAVGDTSLRALAERCRAATRDAAALVEDLVPASQPDLLVLVFGALHRGGHYLYAPEALAATGMIGPATAEALDGALDELYVEVDEALGQILEAVPGAPIFVFSLHGMGAETPWTVRLPQLLALLDKREDAAGTWIERLRATRLAVHLARSLPASLSRSISRLVWRRMRDWRQVRVFPVPSEGIGALRLNLQGRERFGVVRPGSEARGILEDTASALLRLRELASDRPLVERVVVVDDVIADEGPGRTTLPDLVIQWTELPWWECAGVRAADGRTLVFDRPPAVPSGRTGNHRPGGFAWISLGASGGERPQQADAVGLLELADRLAHLTAGLCDRQAAERKAV